MKRGVLVLTAILAIGCATARRQPPALTVVSLADSGVAENESEMDPLVPSFNPTMASGPSSVVNAQFRGTDRKGAKTSIASASTEKFNDVAALVGSLPSDAAMLNHNPAIMRDTQTRATEEKRNVRVPAWIYAIKFEADDDWHVIIGTDPAGGSKTFFNAEVSGLPPASSPAFSSLKKVRQSLAGLLGNALPTGTGYNTLNTPVAVMIEGSLFFDVDHAAGVVGPTGMRPQTAWEVHPITNLSAK
jgi:hypothetical protein